jgi:small subunit ribosomal protein S16
LLRIRLSRVGKKKQPSYRIIVADSRSPRDGAFLKIIGHYNPLTEPTTLVVKEDEAVHWLQKGAKPSDTAAKLLTRIGVMERAGYQGKDVPAASKKKATEPAKPAAKAEPPAAGEPQETITAEAEAPAEEPVAAAEEPQAETETEATSEEPAQEPAENQEAT